MTVSCSFSRGRSDEKINGDLEQAIEDLNAQGLTVFGVEEALKLAVPVVQSTNKIIDVRTGEERTDMLDRAQANLKKFKVSMSKERLEAEYLAGECERLVELCGSLIPQSQQERFQRLKSQLESAIESNNESAMQSLSEDAEQEIRNLPDEVQMVRACFLAINQANAVAPTQASAMSYAKQGNLQQAHREWQPLPQTTIGYQRNALKSLAQRQRMLTIQNIEQLVKNENLEKAKAVSADSSKNSVLIR